MYEVLHTMLIEQNCEVAIASHIKETEDGVILNKPAPYSKCKLFNQNDCINTLVLPDQFSTCVWDKLFKKEVIKDILFSKGKLYEDVIFLTKVLLRTNKIVYNPYPLYHYIQRKNSITGSSSAKKIIAELRELQDRKKMISIEKPELKKTLEVGYCFSIISILGNFHIDKRKYFKLYKYLLKEVQKRAIIALSSSKISIVRKTQLLIIIINPSIMVFLKNIWKVVNKLR